MAKKRSARGRNTVKHQTIRRVLRGASNVLRAVSGILQLRGWISPPYTVGDSRPELVRMVCAGVNRLAIALPKRFPGRAWRDVEAQVAMLWPRPSSIEWCGKGHPTVLGAILGAGQAAIVAWSEAVDDDEPPTIAQVERFASWLDQQDDMREESTQRMSAELRQLWLAVEGTSQSRETKGKRTRQRPIRQPGSVTGTEMKYLDAFKELKSFSAVARHFGRDRKTVEEAIKSAYRKAGLSLPKLLRETRRLPLDLRNDINVAGEEDGPASDRLHSGVRRDRRRAHSD